MSNSSIADHYDELGVKSNLLTSIQDIEQCILETSKKYDIEISHDTMAEEPHSFKSIAYSAYAGCVIAYPQSTPALNSYLNEIIVKAKHNTNEVDIFNNPKDKYISEVAENIPDEIEDLIILPGSNIIERVIGIPDLKHMAKKGAYIKIHPITNEKIRGILKDMFGDRAIDRECGLYEMFNRAKNIYTTSASESVIYASALGKNLYNFEIPGNGFKGAYTPISNNLFWLDKEDRKQYLSDLYYSDISPIFHPSDENVKEKIERFFKHMSKKQNRLDYLEKFKGEG